MKQIIRAILIALVLGAGFFLLIQLVPYGRSHQDPPAVQEPNWDNPQTRALAKRACFNCHSNETVWPWYSNIAPISWLIQHDVDEGRRRLNFSDWTGGGRALREAGEVITEGGMPPFYYTIIHPNSGLSNTEKQQLIQGLQSLNQADLGAQP